MTDTIIQLASLAFFLFGIICTVVFLAMMCANEFGRRK